MTYKEWHTSGESALAQTGSFVDTHNLQERALPDHACYKCASREEFEMLRALREPESVYMHQAYISGRRIAYLKLKKPLNSPLGDVWFLELSNQKSDNSQQSGFDHVELYPTTEAYEAFAASFEQTEKVVKIVRPHHTTFDVTLPSEFIVRLCEEPLVEKIKREEM